MRKSDMPYYRNAGLLPNKPAMPKMTDMPNAASIVKNTMDTVRKAMPSMPNVSQDASVSRSSIRETVQKGISDIRSKIPQMPATPGMPKMPKPSMDKPMRGMRRMPRTPRTPRTPRSPRTGGMRA